MSDAVTWLTERLADAPAQLRARMLDALTTLQSGASIHELLAEAGRDCLARALRDYASRSSALDLLAADAFLTHACEAAAEAGTETLATFATAWSAERFEQLLQA